MASPVELSRTSFVAESSESNWTSTGIAVFCVGVATAVESPVGASILGDDAPGEEASDVEAEWAATSSSFCLLCASFCTVLRVYFRDTFRTEILGDSQSKADEHVAPACDGYTDQRRGGYFHHDRGGQAQPECLYGDTEKKERSDCA